MQPDPDEVIGWLFIEHRGARRWTVLEPELVLAQAVFADTELTMAKISDHHPIRRSDAGRYIMQPNIAVEQPR